MRDREVIARILELGGEFVRQTGSHCRYKATYETVDENGQTRSATAFTSVQVHRGHDIPQGTLRRIQQQMEPAFGKGWLL